MFQKIRIFVAFATMVDICEDQDNDQITCSDLFGIFSAIDYSVKQAIICEHPKRRIDIFCYVIYI